MSEQTEQSNEPTISVGDKIAYRIIEGTTLYQGNGLVTAVHDDGSIDLEWKDSHLTDWQFLTHRRERVPRVTSVQSGMGGTLGAGSNMIEHVNWKRLP